MGEEIQGLGPGLLKPGSIQGLDPQTFDACEH
jgi:hypothetical protein